MYFNYKSFFHFYTNYLNKFYEKSLNLLYVFQMKVNTTSLQINREYIVELYSFFFFRNVVSTVNLGIELPLMYINTRTRNSEYNPARFMGLIMRIRNPRATALIFHSGKIVCTGARSEEDSYLATRKFARIIQKLGFAVRSIIYYI